MKITNKSIFIGDTSKEERIGALSNKNNQDGRKSVFAGDLNENLDPIVQKRKEAQKKAMKVVTDAFKNERKIDEDLDNRRENILKQKQVIKVANEQWQELEAQKVELKEIYGVTEEKTGSEEYKERVTELNKHQAVFQQEIDQAGKIIREENAIIRGVEIERLKTHPVLDAMNQKDAILAAAGDEILRMLVEEGKEHVDEKTEENKEKAEKLQEEKEKQEEQIEAVKEKVEEMIQLEEVKVDVQKEVESIVDKMALVIEDIKGACVDQKL